MFFICGTASKAVPLSGFPCTFICPACGKTAAVHVCWFYDYFHLFFIPLFKFNHRYIATCGSCAAAFQVDTEAGHAFRKGTSPLLPQHLTPIQSGSGRASFFQCPACGRQNPPGSHYCNGCGRPLV